MKQQLFACETMANLRYPCKFIGIAVNTRTMTPTEAEKEIAWAEEHFGLPACDVYRDGPEKLVDAAIALRSEVLKG